MKHPSLIVLKALLLGIKIKHNGDTICMSENNQIGIQLDYPSDQMYMVDWSFNWFMMFCEKLPEQQIVELAAQIALNEMKNV